LDVCHNKCHSEGKIATIRKRGKSWQAQIRLAECPAKSKSFPTKKAAEHWVRIITHQMLDDKATPPASRHTLATLLERYRDNIGKPQKFLRHSSAVLERKMGIKKDTKTWRPRRHQK
jgi:integrase